MPTTVYPVTNSAITTVGRAFDGNVSGRTARLLEGLHSGWDFQATGTALTLKIALAVVGGAGLSASIDGGAYTALTMPGSQDTYTDTTVFTGLTDTTHSVQIRHTSGTFNYIALDQVSSFSLTGAAPAVAIYASNYGMTYPVCAMPIQGFGSIEGWWTTQSNNGYQVLTANGVDCTLRFKAQTSQLTLWGWCASQTYRLQTDGSNTATITASNTSTYDFLPAFTGLDNTAVHEYAIVANEPGFTNLLYGVMAPAGSSIVQQQVRQRPLIVWLGDSITAGYGVTDSTLSFANLISCQKNYSEQNFAVSGQRLAIYRAATNVIENEIWYGAFPPALSSVIPSYIILLAGYNDANQGVAATDFGASYLVTLQQLYASVNVLCLGILNTSTGTVSAVRSAFNSQISTAAATMGGNFLYVNTDNWINPATDTIDGIHPNSSGVSKIVTQLSPYIAMGSAPSGGGGVPGGIMMVRGSQIHIA
jgi:lysophospholipase L1-like esterase